GRLYLRPARRRSGTCRADGDLPRHPPLFGGGCDRDDAPPLLLRRARRAPRARRRLLRRGSDPAHLPYRRGVELPPARRPPGVAVRRPLPPPLGRDVPRRGRVLELPRRRDLWLPDQPPDRLLLRDRDRADREPRPRGDDGRVRDARGRTGAVLPPLPDPGRALVGPRREVELLVSQHRARVDVVRDPVPARPDPAVQVCRRRVLPGPHARVPLEPDERDHRVDPAARRRAVHRRRRASAAVFMLARRPLPSQGRDPRRAGGPPVHGDEQADPRGDCGRRALSACTRPPRLCLPPDTRSSCSSPRSGSTSPRATRIAAPIATGLRASPTTPESTPGSAPRASTCTAPRPTIGGGSRATAAGRISATPVPRRRTAPSRTTAARSCARSTPGPTPRPGASTAG